MKWLLSVTAIFLCLVCSKKSIYILSRLYEGIFVYAHYDYVKQKGCFEELSYREKIVCVNEDYSKEMRECLLGKKFPGNWVFSEGPHMKTYWTSLNGKEYIVKHHIQHGLLKNVMRMGKGVTIWNNLHWIRNQGIKAVEPVAFYEKRLGGSIETRVVYRFEGIGVDHLSKSEMKSKMKDVLWKLRQKYVVHADLRRRNMIYVNKAEDVKLIDVELMHYYPSYSYVCKKRLDKEEKWLLKEFKRH